MLNMKTGENFTDAPMTRRNVLTGLGGIIAAGCAPSIALGAARIVSRDALAGSANASVGGMMRNVGARNAAMFCGEKSDENPYADPSMFFMFDGIWNNGIGSPHIDSIDPSIGLKNCVGYGNMPFTYSKASGTYYDTNCLVNDTSVSVTSIPILEQLPSGNMSEFSIELLQNTGSPGPQSYFCMNTGAWWIFPYNSTVYVNGNSFSMPSSFAVRSIHSYVLSAKSGCQKVYVDGIEFASSTKSFSSFTPSIVALGGYANPSVGRLIDGRYYAVRMLSKFLTAQEVMIRFQEDKRRFGVA